MEFRQLGQSDLQVPTVSFGAWAVGGWMWGGTDDEAAVRAIRRGIDLGVVCIDTAPAYGMGHSETIVGKAIAGRRNDVIIATKCGLRWDRNEGEFFFHTTDSAGAEHDIYKNLRPDSLKEECEASLKRLGIDNIDLYQCHWPDSTTPIEETMEALLELQAEGKVRAIGVSNFSVEQMQECLKKGVIASDQPPYNALRRDIEADVLPFCAEHNIGVLAYSPIAQGLLTGKVTLDREFPESDVRHGKPWFQPKNLKRIHAMLDQVRPVAAGHEATLAQVFIAWVVAQEGVTGALVGARNEQQVAENAKAGDLKLTAEELATVRRLVEDLGEPEV